MTVRCDQSSDGAALPSRRARLAAVSGVVVSCFALLVATSPSGMAWDEGNAILRAAGIRAWVAALRDASWAETTELISAEGIRRHWRYTTQVEGHPALYGILIAVGQAAGERCARPLTAARLGGMAVFALAAGAMFYRLWHDRCLVAAVVGLVALMSMPRLFAHAHFATCDGPLTACWLLTWSLFPAASRNAGGALAWGVALGAAMSCKFTGWLALAPVAASLALSARPRPWRLWLLGGSAALGIFWLANPPLWHEPWSAFVEFVRLNVGRANRPELNVPTQFFGAQYDLHRPLPWYNTLVWTEITVPTGTLALAVIGLASAARRRPADRQALVVAVHWSTLIIARALPWAPPHDAERLFLPSFAFVAVLAGLGAHATWRWARAAARWRRMSAIALLALSCAGSASSLAWYAPQWLSYYNLLIGGLRGAAAQAMEPTYYWDALDAEALAWLHAHTAEGDKIHFAAPSDENLVLMQRWGCLRRGFRVTDPGQFRWHVVQHRPSFWGPADRWLVAHVPPAYAKTIRAPDRGWGSWRLDVPLITVYRYEDYERAQPVAR